MSANKFLIKSLVSAQPPKAWTSVIETPNCNNFVSKVCLVECKCKFSDNPSFLICFKVMWEI